MHKTTLVQCLNQRQFDAAINFGAVRLKKDFQKAIKISLTSSISQNSLIQLTLHIFMVTYAANKK